MERIFSKLKYICVVFLLGTAAATISKAQTAPLVSYIYAIDNAGGMKWYRHDGAATGAATWHGPNDIAAGWQQYNRVFPGNANIIYGITSDGSLTWHTHKGFRAGTGLHSGPDAFTAWSDTKVVGHDWGNFINVFSGGGGIIYAITQEGKLWWYRHIDDANGVKAFEGPKEVGSEWDRYKQVFPGGDGIIYAITQDGSLLWFRHIDYANGAKAFEGPRVIGRGWDSFKTAFSAGQGVIYAITEDGKLQWQKYDGYLSAGGSDTWQGPTEVAFGWGSFTKVFALLPSLPESSMSSSAGRLKQSDTIPAKDRTNSDAIRAAHTSPYQELRCRGGLRFNVVEGRTNSSNEQTKYLIAYFKPSAQPAGEDGRNLQPGQCAFVDRVVRANEPNEIVFEIIYFGQLRQQLHGTPVDTSPTAAERYPDAQNLPQYLNDSNHYWSFFVTQNAPLPSGRFVGSSAGRYWKPAISKEDRIRHTEDSNRINDHDRVLIPKKP